MSIKIADFFSGVGGIALGFTQANSDFEIVYVNDIDKYCKKTHDANNDIETTLKSISDIDPDELPDFDLFCGGFPCQPFSIAGKRLGLKDARANVFFDILRILDAKKPMCILLENVKNLASHNKGDTFKTITKYLEDLGYVLSYKVLNSCKYGNVPQNRERIYIVGFLKYDHEFEFPPEMELTKTVTDCLKEGEVADNYVYTQDSKIYKHLVVEVVQKGVVYQWRRKYVRANKSGVCPTLTANMGTGGHNVPIILDKNGNIRKLTPRECFNIQGYPPSFILPPTISNTQLYKHAGNSVSVPVIKTDCERDT